tara:strand:- start:3329 stop:3724 length:396 start_codon:yes stop_codon:yes gene_type:complete
MAPTFLLVPVPLLTGVLSTAISPKIESTSKLSPPAWVYSVVWSFLYVLIGLSWAVQADDATSLALHAGLVAALTLWTPIYTRVSQTLAILVTAASLALAIVLVILFKAWMLIPLAAWLSFALIINVDQVFG